MKKYFKKHMIRPILYQTCVKVLCALCVAWIWNRFINVSKLFKLSYIFSCISILFAANAWFAFLRLDHVNLPRFPKTRGKKAAGKHGGMTDHIDDPIPDSDELEPDERSFCSFASALLCILIFLCLSLLPI